MRHKSTHTLSWTHRRGRFSTSLRRAHLLHSRPWINQQTYRYPSGRLPTKQTGKQTRKISAGQTISVSLNCFPKCSTVGPPWRHKMRVIAIQENTNHCLKKTLVPTVQQLLDVCQFIPTDVGTLPMAVAIFSRHFQWSFSICTSIMAQQREQHRWIEDVIDT